MGITAGTGSSFKRYYYHPTKPDPVTKPEAESNRADRINMRNSNQSPPTYQGQPSGAPTQEQQLKNLSVDELDAKADSLRGALARPTLAPTQFFEKQDELVAVENELEVRSLDVLEEYLVETQSEFNNNLRLGELYDLANDGTAAPDVQKAAEFYVNHDERRIELGNEVTDGDPRLPDGNSISIAEIHARKLDINSDITNADVPKNTGAGEHELPDHSHNNTTLGLNSPKRTQAVYNNQQDAVETAVRNGNPVQFVTSDGEIRTVRVEVDSNPFTAAYTVYVDDKSFTVESEVGLDETIVGVTNVIEFGSTMGTPDDIRQFPDSVFFNKDAKIKKDKDTGVYGPSNVAADYKADHKMTFYKGDRYIDNENLYHHEIGHGIGRDLDDTDDGKVDASPEGWPDIHQQIEEDNKFVTEYADTNDRESFAEAFAAYVNAKSFGESELQEFREEYTDQAEYLDENVFDVQTAPS